MFRLGKLNNGFDLTGTRVLVVELDNLAKAEKHSYNLHLMYVERDPPDDKTLVSIFHRRLSWNKLNLALLSLRLKMNFWKRLYVVCVR